MNKVEKRKGKRKMWIVILIVIGVIVAGLSGGLLADAPSRREIAKLTFSEGKFRDLHDGTYIGEFKGKKSHMRDAKVEVVIADGKISNITILKGALDKEGKPAELTHGLSMNDLFNKVITSQTLEVDVISGATLTSKAHLKAVENALEQAK